MKKKVYELIRLEALPVQNQVQQNNDLHYDSRANT